MSELSINPPFNSNLSPDEIRRRDPTQLGIGFFCFLVAELLKAKFPRAEFWRLTNPERTTYAHVFVRIDGKPYDIHGFREIKEMCFDLDDDSLVEEITDARAIQDYFSKCNYSKEQLSAAREVLNAAIESLNL